MINSLRLQGHDEPVYLLDAGLTEQQRSLLESQVTLVAAADDRGPHLQKTIAPLRHPHEVMVLLDVDMVVTRPLGELLEAAASGRVVAFENDLDRFFSEWGEMLELGPLSRSPYLCSGFVAMPADPGVELLELIDDRQRHVDYSRTLWVGNDVDYPLLYADQDVFNAVLASRPEASRVFALGHRMMAARPFDEPRLLDVEALRCDFPEGEHPYVVHHILPAKPWLEPMFHGAYSRLLRRCLVGSGLAIRVPAPMLPLRMRSGTLGSLERRRVAAGVALRFHLGFHLDRLGISR
jgi:hypothetical protein